MEPVDKIKARADALNALGLDQSAGPEDIREAWRQIAFHAHPDHTGGDYSDFSQAKSAYDFLRKEGLTGKGAEFSAMPRRPRLKKRVIELAAEEIAACRARLNPDLALSHLPDAPDADCGDGTCRDKTCESDHVPDAVGCFGRDLTFFVATPVCEGANRVALPTSVLTSRRHNETEILSFQSRDSGSGDVVIPDTIRERKFPGAKSVKIRFEADQQIRDEFWIAS